MSFNPSFMSKRGCVLTALRIISLLIQVVNRKILVFKNFFGDPYRIRTDVNGVRGRCLNHLTNGPLVQLQGLEPGTH